MKNLFVCHTQANLILASGLALGRFKDDENLLILFVDFGLKDELKERLDKTFAHTLYLQSIYPPEFNTAKAKLMKHTLKGDFNWVTAQEVENLMKGDASGRVKR